MPPFARLPTSSSRPPAPWSVPPESLSSGRRPNSLQIIVSTRSREPARVEVGLPGAQRVAQVLQQVGVRLRLRVVRVEAAARDRGDARAEARAEQAAEVAERLAEIAVGIGHRRRRRLVLLGQRREAVVRLDRVAVHRAHGGQAGCFARARERRAVGRQEGLLVPHVRDVEAEVRGRGDAGDGRAACRSGTDPGPSRRGCPAAGCRACRSTSSVRPSQPVRSGAGPTMPLRQ